MLAVMIYIRYVEGFWWKEWVHLGIWNWWPIGTSVEATEYAIVYIAFEQN